MKIFFNYILLPKSEINDYVFNRSSNNVWPTFKRDQTIKQDWVKKFEEQNKVVKDYLKYLETVKRKDEHFVIRIVNDINTKLKALNAREKNGNHWIERNERIVQEIKNLREGLNFPEYQAIREQLTNWYSNPEASLARVQEIFAHYQIGQWETIRQHFQVWNQNRPHPIKEVNDILQEWSANSYRTEHESYYQIETIKSLQIELKERTKDTITFVWRIPTTTEKDEKGKEFKNRVFPSIPYYLFFLNGVFYEVLDWEQTGWGTAEIVAEESIFYNGYWWLLKGGVSGIIRNSPVGVSEEVCACFNTDFLNAKNKFYCNIRLTFDCWKISKAEMKNKNAIDDPSGGFSMIVAGQPVKIGQKGLFEKALEETVLGFLPPEVRERIRGEQENRTPEQENRERTRRELDDLDSGWKKFGQFFMGQSGIIFLLLNRRLKEGASWYYNLYHRGGCIDTEITQPLRFLRVDESRFDKISQESNLKEPDYLQFLKDEKMLENEMYHPLMEHVQVTFMWRNKPVWKGIYREISSDLRIWETVSPAGNCFTAEAGGQILFSIKELVTAKIGGDDKTSSFWSTLITVTTTVAAAAATGGMAAGVAATATKAGIGAVGALASRGVSNLVNQGTGFTETSYTMTIHEFRHKYLISGTYPLSMNLEWCQEVITRYRNNRELLGVNTSTFVNNAEFGSYLNTPGFLRFSEIFSLGVIGGERTEWFKQKLLEGIFLNNQPYQSYEKKLSGAQITSSIGGTVRKDWNEMVYSEVFTVAITEDDLSHAGGGMWIYKTSQLTIGSQGNKMGWAMDYLERNFGILNKQDSGKWVIKHPGASITNHKLEIPAEWCDTEKNGVKTARVHYHMISFGRNGRSESKNDPIDEHWCDYIIINKWSSGNTTKITFGLHGTNITKNKTPGAENVPPSGTLPVNPLSSGGGVPNPLGIGGIPPPGGSAEIITPPGSGGDPEIEPPEPEPEVEKEPETEKEQEQEEEIEQEVEKEPEPEKPDEEKDPEAS